MLSVAYTPPKSYTIWLFLEVHILLFHLIPSLSGNALALTLINNFQELKVIASENKAQVTKIFQKIIEKHEPLKYYSWHH
jgi:hypothetical protein